MAAPSTGFIRPPPEIRPIVEKTAQFVAKNGPEFEAKILDKEAGNVKFAFLAPSNPYHAYYKHCVELAKNPEAAAVAAAAKAAAAAVSESKKSEQQTGASADSTGTAAASASASAAAPASKPVTTASTVRRTVYLNPVARVMKSIDFAAPPPRDEYTVPQPPFVPLEDLELIRAAAQYTAANGTAFIDSIRESQERNPQFDFLRHTHALYPYFQDLTTAYMKIVKPPPALGLRLTTEAMSRQAVFQRVVHRMEAKRREDEAKRKANEAAELEANANIVDWQNFTIVETIAFGNDEEEEGLPAPTLMPGSVAGGYRPAPLAPSGPGSYAAMLAAAGGGAGASASAAGAGGYVPAGYAAAAADEDGMDVEMEMETEDAEPAPAPAAAAAASSAAAAAQAPARGEERLNVRYDYTPQLPSAASAVQAPTTFIDPRTGHAVPIDQATEHLRVELLDPQWAIQREKSMRGRDQTLYAGGEDVADNLRHLARKRGDVFGDDAAPAGAPGPGTAAAIKKARTDAS